ncbi:glycosyltransferase family 2 protein [Enorma phocaeensis]|uniref:glycosyltransferase family 2 protein n=1 Tax=Enorma phocaeensis TaxID=1871019 RepID=UPI0023525B2D|nr:glycosyltransferase family 2 protein [Enorma phocaeensis]
MGTDSGERTVAVVMSTYNGAVHLREQVESVLAQDYPSLELIVRDDGSSDGTVEILEEYEHAGALRLIRGENRGVVGSFLDGIAQAPPNAAFVALCDQDDVWHSDKISRAVAVLSTRDNAIPQMYCSEYMFCDADMNPRERSHLNRIGVGFPTMLYENMVSGNTVVINRKLADLIAAAGREGVYTHDWWLGLVATALGELTYDDFVSLEYRRTGSNASPTGTSAWNILRYRVRTFFKGEQLRDITVQLRRLYDLYADKMPAQRRRLLERFLFGGRAAKALVPVRLRQKPIEELALRVLFLMGSL